MERQQQIIDGLPVHVFDTRAEMGGGRSRGAAHIIREAIDKKGEANVVFAAAPSQDDLIASLLGQDIDWRRVRGFHQDEYIGLTPRTAPASAISCAVQFLTASLWGAVLYGVPAGRSRSDV